MSDLQQVLLEQLAGTAPAGSGTSGSMSDLLAAAMGGDPAMAPVIEALRAREANAAATDEPVPDDGPGPSAAPDPLPAEVADVLERLHAEVLDLRRRTRELAAALGACARCFGEDAGCRRCGGRGVPGARDPEPVLFHELVAPVVRRHQRRADPQSPVVQHGRAPSPGPSGPAEPSTQGDQGA
ncbi:MAG: hypothetical protein ACRCSN_10005 [Dermatophilaceae bacterium]